MSTTETLKIGWLLYDGEHWPLMGLKAVRKLTPRILMEK